MDRRKFLSLLGAASSGLGVHRYASARLDCIQHGFQNICDEKIQTNNFKHVFSNQETDVWCWAATFEMIFRWHGKNISQKSIVAQTFGNIIRVPGSIPTLINGSNRDYIDDFGQPFKVRSRIWSMDAGIIQFDNSTIIQALANDRPLVVCNLSHMMVLVGVSYVISPGHIPMIREGWVADPLVFGNVTRQFGGRALADGFRYLTPPELVAMYAGGQLRFMADVHVI
ncbi:MAG: hypothetical protein M0Q95_20395 [Porticoccaceae bacterium]|nr:hypothetical protein [Porticoccaceae bacterium]